MKRTYIITAFLIFCLLLRASEVPNESGVEIRFRLLQQTDGSSIKNLAVSISIINHSNQDIYIPGFDAGPYRSGIHLYVKHVNGFEQMDLLGQPDWHGGDARFITQKKEISRYFDKKHLSEKVIQDSLLKVFCTGRQFSLEDWMKTGNKPLFLKGGQELGDYVVYDLNFILKQPGEFKIAFDHQMPVNYQYSPDLILTYKKVLPTVIESNTIYYDVLEEK
jgi:hypothetical protein